MKRLCAEIFVVICCKWQGGDFDRCIAESISMCRQQIQQLFHISIDADCFPSMLSAACAKRSRLSISPRLERRSTAGARVGRICSRTAPISCRCPPPPVALSRPCLDACRGGRPVSDPRSDPELVVRRFGAASSCCMCKPARGLPQPGWGRPEDREVECPSTSGRK